MLWAEPLLMMPYVTALSVWIKIWLPYHRYLQCRATRTTAANSLVLMWCGVSLGQSFAHWEYIQSPQQKAPSAVGHESENTLRVAGERQMRRRLWPVVSQVAHQVMSHWMEATRVLCPRSLRVENSGYIERKWDLPQGVTWEAQLSLPASPSSCIREALLLCWKSFIISSVSPSFVGLKDNSPATVLTFTPKNVIDWPGSWIFYQFIWKPSERSKVMRAYRAALQLLKSGPVTKKSSK